MRLCITCTNMLLTNRLLVVFVKEQGVPFILFLPIMHVL